MIASVKMYYNTGLTPTNCLDSLNLLDSLNFDNRVFDNIAIKQDRGIFNIRINTTYGNVKDADYCVINGTNGYWVTNVIMLNDNVAEVLLQQDCLTTVGLYPLFKLGIISGWCTRRHVINDDIYTNIIDEPFVPTNELVMEKGTVIAGDRDAAGFESIVLSTVDLLNITNTAQDYIDNAGDKVLVPELPSVSGVDTIYYSNMVTPEKSASIALSNAFSPLNEDVKKGLISVRQLGVESCIGAAYMLPKSWADVTINSNGLIAEIRDKHEDVQSALSSTWGTYKNNKVYTGQFQKIVVFSMASGDSCENRIEDILDQGNNITWATFADCRYSGRPGCKPKYYKGTLNSALMQSVHGANWQQTPFVYNVASGNIFGSLENDISLRRSMNNFGNQMLMSLSDLPSFIGNMASIADVPFIKPEVVSGVNLGVNYNDIMNSSGGVFNAAKGFVGVTSHISNMQYNRQSILTNANRSMLGYDIKFPQVPNLADYVGNSFYDIRYRLSDNDMVRFDNFLTAYGYAVDEELKAECLVGRENFNYIQARDVSLKVDGFPQYLIDGMAKQIESGVRIWHKAPSHSALMDNPII